VGTVAAFIVSYLSIVWLLRFVSTHSFRVFGIYRIIAGAIIVGLALLAAQIFQ
jgi:undecaprenyl-diphosphatase